MALRVDNKEAHVLLVGEIETGISKAGNAWKKIDILLSVSDGRYENDLNLTAWNDKVDVVQSMLLRKGSKIQFDATIKSNKYGEKYFTNATLDGIRNLGLDTSTGAKDISPNQGVAVSANGEVASDYASNVPQENTWSTNNNEYGDDLPF